MNKKRVTYIISHVHKALAFEWIVEAFEKSNIELSFIVLNAGESLLESFLKEKQVPVVRVTYSSKKNIIGAFWKVFRTLKKWKPEVVHCHLFDASLIGLYAAKWAGIPKRIYTRHHALIHWDAHPKTVKYDKMCNTWATDIVAITHDVANILIEKEGAEANKVQVIHHGFKLELWDKNSISDLKTLQTKYNPAQKHPVIGVIARWVEEKGIQYIIPAFQRLLNTYPNALLLFANARGVYKPTLDALLKEIPSENYQLIEFEPKIEALYALMDIYVHVPIGQFKEPFGQTYIEALAAEKPCVFTLSGIACTFIEHQKNAWVVPFQDSEAIYEGIKNVLENPDLAQQLAQQGKKDVYEAFQLSAMIQSLAKLYE